MVELVKFIVEQFIADKSKLQITLDEIESKETITICVADEDMGKIIGKQGRIAKAIRTIVKAAAAKVGKKYTVEIISEKEKQSK